MQRKPLKNIRVLELGGYISVPYASSLLSALGADVVKVESRPAGMTSGVRSTTAACILCSTTRVSAASGWT